MNSFVTRSSLAMLLWGFLAPCAAYDLATHARMTQAAYTASILGEGSSVIESRLGLDVWTQRTRSPFRTRFGDFYFDMSVGNGLVFARSAKPYEISAMPGRSQNPDILRINGWLMRGAIREDDGGLVAAIKNWEPYDDPYGNFNRYCNHFYDPVVVRSGFGRAFSGFCFNETPLDAVQWVLGSLDPFQTPAVELAARRNHFTVLDAREAMWRALTLRDRAGNDVPRFGYTGEEVRKIYWATTFRALGDVVHMLQDTAQPQHTRNEGHPLAGGSYEGYLEARARRAPAFVIDALTLTSTQGELPDLTFTGYAAPQFARYADFFTTSRADGDVPAGRGLADYSNRGFFTVDANYGNTVYPWPTSDPSAYQQVTAPANALPYPDMTFHYLNGEVRDQVANQTNVISMTTEGLFEKARGTFLPALPPIYVLNRKNFDDRASLLIPRAVGYSAGFLNHVFRGEMELSLPQDGVYAAVDHGTPAGNHPQTGGFRKVKVKVRNLTPAPASTGIDPMDSTAGQLVAIARFHRNNCYAADLSGEYGSPGMSWQACRNDEQEIVVSDPATVPTTINSEASPVTFTFTTPIPISATDLHLQVAYRGPLGNEQDAVVVQTKDISEPTYAYNFFTWDQFKYNNYPDLNPGPLSFDQWCSQGYPSIQSCYDAMGSTRKYKFSPDASYITGYDPAISQIPQGTWTNLGDEPPFSPLLKSVTPVGALTRMAILMDATPANIVLFVEELIDAAHGTGVFQWVTGLPLSSINQLDYSTNPPSLVPPVTYVSGRGVYVPIEEQVRIEGRSPGVTPPNLVVVPSQISF